MKTRESNLAGTRGTVLCGRCKRVWCNLPANVCTMCLLIDPQLREGER